MKQPLTPINNTSQPTQILAVFLAVGTVVIAGMTLAGCNQNKPTEANPTKYKVIDTKDANKEIGTYTVPQNTAIMDEPNAKEILYGQRLLNETKRLLPNNTGDNMNCNSCHISSGKIPLGAPYINSFNTYPAYKARAGKEVSLKERINGCFKRSMNGAPLKPDSAEMQAMIAYMKWLAKNVDKQQTVAMQASGKIDTNLIPDPVRGEKIYQAQCSSCHGVNGEGKTDNLGIIAFPPLWGDASFNIGAGMARTYTAAAFIKYNMPMGIQTKGLWGHGGVLSDQDAVDVAEFFTHQPRPDFPEKVNDWPNGDKPKDARY